MSTDVRRAVVYTRVSSEDQIENTSLDTQRRRCEDFCRAKGWSVTEVFVDEGVSGTRSSRPRLDAMMAACRAGQADVVVVYKTDRFSRSRAHLFSALEEMASWGVAFTSVTEAFDTSTTHGDAMVGMLGVFAQMERNIIRERTRSGLNARVRAGGWGGGRNPPFGYRIVGVDRDAHLEVDEREAAVVLAAVGMVLDAGLSTLDVAKRLNALGLTPRTAPLWTSSNLRNCLTRGQWDGRWTFGKTSPKGTVPEPIVVPVSPILTSERSAQLVAHLGATTIKRGRAGVHPLSGRLLCLCGEPMTGIARGDRANRRYRCRHGRHTPGRPFCSYPSLLADRVDAAVWKETLTLLTQPALLRSLAQERLEVLAGAGHAEGDAFAQGERAVQRTQAALASASARCFALDLDVATTAATVRVLQDQYRAAVQHLAMVANMRVATDLERRRASDAEELAALARQHLVTAGKELQAKVFALLDVQVTVVDAAPLRLELVGSVAHELLLTDLRGGLAPGALTSACA